MSEMTRAEEQEAADAMLESQIEEWCRQRLLDPTEPHWFDDPDEVVAFARWYWENALNFIGSAGEILDYFEKPWLFNEEYDGFVAQKVKVI